MRRTLHGKWLGRRPYRPVLALQERLALERMEGRGADTVLFLEHEPVITLGRGADPSNVLLAEDVLRARGIDVAPTTRGGDVTLHAPGQLVCYPILDLNPDRRDVRRYVKDLTETMRRVALEHGVSSGTVPGLIGLWVDRASIARFPGAETLNQAKDLAKLGAIGVRISRWVTTHGFALNLTTATDLFDTIVPCGIRDHGVTSLLELTGKRVEPKHAAARALAALSDVLDADAGDLEDWSERDLAAP